MAEQVPSRLSHRVGSALTARSIKGFAETELDFEESHFFSVNASSMDFGPRTMILRLSWRVSGEIVFPRTVFFFRIPVRGGWKPTPPERRILWRRGPGRSLRIGNPSLSLPPVIASL